MKRSEMTERVYTEIRDALAIRPYSNETDEAYWMRRSKMVLDMLVGFGMLPPAIENDGYTFTTLDGKPLGLSVPKHLWESENETK